MKKFYYYYFIVKDGQVNSVNDTGCNTNTFQGVRLIN